MSDEFRQLDPSELAMGREQGSEALKAITKFQAQIDSAAILLSSAFAEAAVTDFRPEQRRKRSGRAPANWYSAVIDTCLDCSRSVRSALVHPWQPTPRAERLAVDAFVLLSDLTPSKRELRQLCQYDRPRAFAELARHLDVLIEQIELSANLIAEVDVDDKPQAADEKSFERQREELLDKAGGTLSLTEAADLIGISRQGLHKRIKAHSVLGMMHGNKLVIPRAQFAKRRNGYEVLEGLEEILKAFKVAGEWSALQFLVEPDPNLGRPPLHALSEGQARRALEAAKAYLDAAEE